MGLSSNASRLMLLKSKADKLTTSAETISKQRQQLAMEYRTIQAANEANASLYDENDTNTQLMQSSYDSQIAQITEADAKLEQELQSLENQREAIAQELESVKDLVNEKIFSSFIEEDTGFSEGLFAE